MGITRRDETEGILVFEESLRPPPRCDPERNTNRLFGIKFLRPGGEELDQAGESEVDGKTTLIFLVWFCWFLPDPQQCAMQKSILRETNKKHQSVAPS